MPSDAAAVRAAAMQHSDCTNKRLSAKWLAEVITDEYKPLAEAARKIAWVVEAQGVQSAHMISSEDCARLCAALRSVVG